MSNNSFNEGAFKSIHSFRGGVRVEWSFLDEWKFEFDTPYWVRVIENNLCLDIYIQIKRGEKIIFAGQDALIDGRRFLPYFYRTKWVDMLPCSFVTFNDPSLYETNDFGSGYLLAQNSWNMVKRAVDKIILSLQYKECDSIFYGASAGGYWALSMAGSYRNSVFLVDIPQINLDTYFRGEMKERFKNHFNITGCLPNVFDYWSVLQWPKNITYLQNRRDKFHIRTQYSYFLRRASEIAEIDSDLSGRLNVLFYTTPPETRSHSPLSQNDTIQLLKKLIFSNHLNESDPISSV